MAMAAWMKFQVLSYFELFCRSGIALPVYTNKCRDYNGSPGILRAQCASLNTFVLPYITFKREKIQLFDYKWWSIFGPLMLNTK